MSGPDVESLRSMKRRPKASVRASVRTLSSRKEMDPDQGSPSLPPTPRSQPPTPKGSKPRGRVKTKAMVSREETKGVELHPKAKRQVLADISQRDEDLEKLVITETVFALMSYEEITKEAHDRKIYKDGDLGSNTVGDIRMGTIDPRSICVTCHRDNLTCPGHYGYIDISDVGALNPIFNSVQNSIIVQVLSSVCNSCGGLLISRDEMESEGFLKYTGAMRLRMIKEKSFGRPCMRKHDGDMGTSLSPTTARAIGLSPSSSSIHGELMECDPNPVYKVPKSSSGGVFIKYSQEIDDDEDDEEESDTTDSGIVWPVATQDVENERSVFKILDSISKEDAILLGFEGESHPRDMVMRAVVVMPPSVRKASLKEGMPGRDEYAVLYNKIIKAYNEYQNPTLDPSKKETLAGYLKNRRSLIQECVNAIITNYNTKNLRISESHKPIISRVQDKKKGIRGNTLGKRTNYSGRTVAGPEPSLRFYQIGLPEAFKKTLTQIVVVTPLNYEPLMGLMMNGHITHIIPSEGDSAGQRIRVTYSKDPVSNEIVFSKGFNIGDFVVRWGQDGDIILGNRQPTIHKQGILGFEAVFLKGNTVRFALSATPLMNMDFDGDDGNVHAPQTIDAIIDTMAKLDIRNQIINAQDNRQIVSPVMDSITAAYRLTSEGYYVETSLLKEIIEEIPKDSRGDRIEAVADKIKINRKYRIYVRDDIWYEILGLLESSNLYEKYSPRIMGSDVLKSHVYIDNDLWNDILMLLVSEDWMGNRTDIKNLKERLHDKGIYPSRDPSDGKIKYSGRALFSALLPPDFSYQKGNVIILDGILVSGTITKDTLGSSHNSIGQDIYKKYPIQRVIEFIIDAPRLLERWITEEGFSIGLDDCDFLTEDNLRDIRTKINKIKTQVKQLGPELNDPLEEEYRSNQIVAYLGNVKNFGGLLSEKMMTYDNSLNSMALSGAKGGLWNIAQIIGGLGQQFIRGGRAPAEMTGRTRSLPYFKPGDLDPRARGFIENSFYSGLTPAEMIFHQAAGREGLIDTANKTSDVGALRRDISKLMEDVRVGPNGEAIGVGGRIIQPVYGNDGFDGKDLINVKSGEIIIPSFIDFQSVALQINAKHGYMPRGYKRR